MPEYSTTFTAGQIQAMRAARPLAELMAFETLGYDPLAGQRRTLLAAEADSSQTIITLEAPETTEVTPFREMWRHVLRGTEHASYHQLDVISTGIISATRAVAEAYDTHHTYLVHRPSDETVHGLGIVVTLPILLKASAESHTPHGDRTSEALIAHRPGRVHILDVAGTQALLQTVQIALEAGDI